MNRNIITYVLLIALFATFVLAVDKNANSKQGTLDQNQFSNTLEKAHTLHKQKASSAATKHAPLPKETAAAAEADAKKHDTNIAAGAKKTDSSPKSADKSNSNEYITRPPGKSGVETTTTRPPGKSGAHTTTTRPPGKSGVAEDTTATRPPGKSGVEITRPPGKSGAHTTTQQGTSAKQSAIKNTRKTLKIRDDLPDYAKAAKLKLNSFIESGKSWPGQPDVMGCTPLECQEWCDECDGSITCQSKCFNNLYCRDECAVLLS